MDAAASHDGDASETGRSLTAASTETDHVQADGAVGGWRKPVATLTPMMREPTEPQASIKATGVGIPHLQAWEEVN